MGRPPLDPSRSIVPLGAAVRSAICGGLLAIGALGAFVYYLPYGEPYARSLAMVTAVIGSVLLIFAELAGELPWWRTPDASRCTLLDTYASRRPRRPFYLPTLRRSRRRSASPFQTGTDGPLRLR